jgi:uncharacterized membrane protein required for colicin V production
MFAAIAQKSSWLTDKLTFNWFDLAVVLMLACGYLRGRKNGMSKEVLLAPKWVGMVVAAGLGYLLLGAWLIQTGVVKSTFGNLIQEKTAAYVSAYLLIALAVTLVFSLINRMIKAKVTGGNYFGNGEYYLGMLSGMVRYACMLIFFLALLHAPVYSLAEIQAQAAYNNKWYGGGMAGYDGNFIPSINDVQTTIFNKSVFGPAITNGLDRLLINTRPGGKAKSGAPAPQPVIHMGS